MPTQRRGLHGKRSESLQNKTNLIGVPMGCKSVAWAEPLTLSIGSIIDGGVSEIMFFTQIGVPVMLVL